MLRIGLTGGIASGKSTVSQRFSELGIPVIDADIVSRELVSPGSVALAAIVERFGAGVLKADGDLDRPALRQLIFSDAAARRDLNGILHPLIRTEMETLANHAAGPYLIMAIPLLVEGGGGNRVDRVLVVDVEEVVQLERVRLRDAGTEQQARAILAAQASRAERLAAADDVLRNSGSVADLRRAVDDLHQQYLRLAKG